MDGWMLRRRNKKIYIGPNGASFVNKSCLFLFSGGVAILIHTLCLFLVAALCLATPPVVQLLILSHGPLNEPPPDGAVGAGRLDVELLDQSERLRHEQCHPKGQQGGHEGIQGRLLCLEGDLELGRSGTLAEAGSECILAKESDYGREFECTALFCCYKFPWHVATWLTVCFDPDLRASNLRSSTRSSALRMSSRRASQKTRLNPSERSCRSSSTTSERTTKRMSPWRPLTMMPCRRRLIRLAVLESSS